MELKNVLEANHYLTEEVRKDIESNLDVLLESFPNIDKEYVEEKLKELQIKPLPKFGEYEDVRCINPNIVYVSIDSLKNKDGRNINMQILLKTLFPNTNVNLESLHNGMTEMIANTLVGGSSLSDEYFICELLEEIINLDKDEYDTMETAYFSGNMSLIVPFIEDKLGHDISSQLLDMCNQNYMRRKTNGQSLFPEIEKYLIKSFYSLNPNKESINSFDNKLVLDPRIFDEQANRYMGLYEVVDMYDSLKNSYYIDDKSKVI